jgi:hypothetical protein
MALTTSDYQAQRNYAQGAVLGGDTGAKNAMVQPTVASALGRIESLNERLDQVTKQLAGISNAVGGPRPAGVNETGQVAPSGIVYRLNDGANAAHRQVDDINELIGAIARALG